MKDTTFWQTAENGVTYRPATTVRNDFHGKTRVITFLCDHGYSYERVTRMHLSDSKRRLRLLFETRPNASLVQSKPLKGVGKCSTWSGHRIGLGHKDHLKASNDASDAGISLNQTRVSTNESVPLHYQNTLSTETCMLPSQPTCRGLTNSSVFVPDTPPNMRVGNMSSGASNYAQRFASTFSLQMLCFEK